jgi:hypothetical protein
MSEIDMAFTNTGSDNIPICEFTAPDGRRFEVILMPDKQGLRFANALAKILEALSETIPSSLWPLDPEEA